MGVRPHVVFDCNVYFQALISAEGPSARCVETASRGQVVLYCSEPTIAELLDVASRPALRAKFRITDAKVANLIAAVRAAAVFVKAVPERYSLAADPNDSHYINLAVATDSHLIVSRDRDLLRLMELTRREGVEFQRLFPHLRVIQPEALILMLQSNRQA